MVSSSAKAGIIITILLFIFSIVVIIMVYRTGGLDEYIKGNTTSTINITSKEAEKNLTILQFQITDDLGNTIPAKYELYMVTTIHENHTAKAVGDCKTVVFPNIKSCEKKLFSDELLITFDSSYEVYTKEYSGGVLPGVIESLPLESGKLYFLLSDSEGFYEQRSFIDYTFSTAKNVPGKPSIIVKMYRTAKSINVSMSSDIITLGVVGQLRDVALCFQWNFDVSSVTVNNAKKSSLDKGFVDMDSCYDTDTDIIDDSKNYNVTIKLIPQSVKPSINVYVVDHTNVFDNSLPNGGDMIRHSAFNGQDVGAMTVNKTFFFE